MSIKLGLLRLLLLAQRQFMLLKATFWGFFSFTLPFIFIKLLGVQRRYFVNYWFELWISLGTVWRPRQGYLSAIL
ncbi:hypothetical protein DK26_07280 [Bosea sp. WAO]|nr:hypothetical protein DK26_07280 [Bosea sp. WAO]